MRYALIQGGKVANVVEQDSTPTIAGEWVDITGQHVGPGFSYDGVNFTAPSEKENNNAELYAKIAALEAGQMRGMREFMLTGDKTGLKSVDDKIVALRAKLEK